MKHQVNGKWYCETRDVEGVNQNSLKVYLSRGREGEFWKNIPNPHFNNRNSRRLILIESIPDAEVRQKVLSKLQLSLDHHEGALLVAEKAGLGTVSRTATEATSQTLRTNAVYLARHLTSFLEKEHLQYVGNFTQYSLQTPRMITYARTAAFAYFVFEQLRDIHQLSGGHAPTFRRDYRSFRMNLITVLEEEITDLDVPVSDQRFKGWCDRLLVKSKQSRDPAEWIEVKRSGNRSAGRLTADQKKVACSLYLENAMPVNQVYDALVALGRKRGDWWVKDGEFSPISKGTLYNYMDTVKEKLDREREGRIAFALNHTPSISREYPTKTNMVWGFDGTAHDEYVDNGGKILQSLNIIRVFDYASLRLLSTVAFKGGERAKHYIQAFREAVAVSGYAPEWVQTDNSSAIGEFSAWLEGRSIKHVPAKKGLARAKLVENLLGRMGNLVYRHTATAWSGQNLTARGKNSRLSPEHSDKKKQGAKGIVRAAQWACNEAVKEWNSLIIEQLAGKTCRKTPNELWNGKASASKPLEPFYAAVTFGYHHQVQLTINGADIQHTDSLGHTHQYTYFPTLLESEEDINKTIEVYQKLPHTRRHAVRVHVYLTEYGKEAYVFENAWGGTQPPSYLGQWVIKPLVSMAAAQEGDTKELRRWLDFAKAYEESAKEFIGQVDRSVRALEYYEDVESVKKDPLQGRKRKVKAWRPEMDKERLAMEEQLWKLSGGDESRMAGMEEEMEEYIDPYTGEVIEVLKRNDQGSCQSPGH